MERKQIIKDMLDKVLGQVDYAFDQMPKIAQRAIEGHVRELAHLFDDYDTKLDRANTDRRRIRDRRGT